MIKKLNKNQIFIFGSNMSGLHIGGAAKQAFDYFGAEWGVGDGITGKCYAFPTLRRDMKKYSIQSLIKTRNRLYETCKSMKDKEFLLTKVGCGIACYDENIIKLLFSSPPKNLVLPEDWE